MLTLLAALLAAAPAPPLEPAVACFVDPRSITHVVVCVDRNGKKSWVA